MLRSSLFLISFFQRSMRSSVGFPAFKDFMTSSRYMDYCNTRLIRRVGLGSEESRHFYRLSNQDLFRTCKTQRLASPESLYHQPKCEYNQPWLRAAWKD